MLFDKDCSMYRCISWGDAYVCIWCISRAGIAVFHRGFPLFKFVPRTNLGAYNYHDSFFARSRFFDSDWLNQDVKEMCVFITNCWGRKHSFSSAKCWWNVRFHQQTVEETCVFISQLLKKRAFSSVNCWRNVRFHQSTVEETCIFISRLLKKCAFSSANGWGNVRFHQSTAEELCVFHQRTVEETCIFISKLAMKF